MKIRRAPPQKGRPYRAASLSRARPLPRARALRRFRAAARTQNATAQAASSRSFRLRTEEMSERSDADAHRRTFRVFGARLRLLRLDAPLGSAATARHFGKHEPDDRDDDIERHFIAPRYGAKSSSRAGRSEGRPFAAADGERRTNGECSDLDTVLSSAKRPERRAPTHMPR